MTTMTTERTSPAETKHQFQVGDWVQAPSVWEGDPPYVGEIIARDGEHPGLWRVEYELPDLGGFVVNVEHPDDLTFIGTERPER